MPRRMNREIRHGDRTPWGRAEDPKKLGTGVYSISTAGHGGVYMGADARRAIPPEVRRTFLNGGAWAEEDCEMQIALALLEAGGKVPEERLWTSVSKLRRLALDTAQQYDRYNAAIPHLKQLMRERGNGPGQESEVGVEAERPC